MDDYHLESFDASEGEDDRQKLWLLMRKMWLPVFFVFTVLGNWDNPFSIAIRILLFLLSTKPSPSSIYLFVERVSKRYFHLAAWVYHLTIKFIKLDEYCVVSTQLGDMLH